jgi:Universal stress protein family
VREIVRRTEQDLRERRIDCTTMVDEGESAEVLVRLAEECDADLLVIGNRGMRRRVLGSVPNTVTHKGRCSVYVVKAQGDGWSRCSRRGRTKGLFLWKCGCLVGTPSVEELSPMSSDVRL